MSLVVLDPEEQALLGVVRRLAAARIAPRAAEDERQARFPREVFEELGALAVLGLPFPTELAATDAAMQTTVDAVQVLGGVGYATDLPAERYLREAKVLQLVEGTNQIQRLVIARSLRPS